MPLPEGIYSAPCRNRGRPVLVQISAKGCLVGWRVVPRGEDPELERELVPLPRGVHPAPFLSSRCLPVLLAIDSRGDYVAFREINSWGERDMAERALWRELEDAEPVKVTARTF